MDPLMSVGPKMTADELPEDERRIIDPSVELGTADVDRGPKRGTASVANANRPLMSQFAAHGFRAFG